jgi:hypothetical protein
LADFERKLSGRAAWSVAFLLTTGARAQTAPEPQVVTASLELVSLPGCGSPDELARAIRARSERIRIEDDARASRRLRIELRESGGGVTTLLTLTQPSGRRSSRTLRAAGCAEALEGAALVAAVSLDPTASAASVAAAADVAPAPAPLTSTATSPRPCPRCEAASSAPPGAAPRLEWSALLSFDTVWGPAPKVMLGFGASLLGAYERDSVLSPAVRLSFSHFTRGGFEVTGGSAEFSLDVGSLELCPLRARAGPLRLYPCLLRVAAGRLEATGSHTEAPQSRGRPWGELGSSLLAQVRPGGALELDLSVAAGWPWARDRFQFEPIEFHKVSGVVWSLGAAAGVTFP